MLELFYYIPIEERIRSGTFLRVELINSCGCFCDHTRGLVEAGRRGNRIVEQLPEKRSPELAAHLGSP